MKTVKKIKSALTKSINSICKSKDKYCVNPQKDFTRNSSQKGKRNSKPNVKNE